MASLVTRPNGHWWVQIKIDGIRKTIRLGNHIDKRGAEEMRRRIAALNASRLAGISPDEATASWVGKLDRDLHRRLAATGLIASRNAYTLGEFLEYVFTQLEVKESTRISYTNVKRNLLDFFGPSKAINSISAGDAGEFSRWLATQNGVRKDKLMSKATVSGRTRRARQFFNLAVKKRWLTENPFSGIRVASQQNPEKMRFVDQETIQKVMEELPDDEYRLILALARFGGLRCPSEPLALRWEHINWDAGTMRVEAPKTGTRIVPIFEELRPYLDRVWESLDDSPWAGPWVISRHRITGQAMTSIVTRAVYRAGVPIWPKLFQNLRATRETELMERFPVHVVCKWIGNSPKIAAQHYLQVTEDHVAAATGARSEAPKSEARRKAREARISHGS
jgi:integrase